MRSNLHRGRRNEMASRLLRVLLGLLLVFHPAAGAFIQFRSTRPTVILVPRPAKAINPRPLVVPKGSTEANPLNKGHFAKLGELDKPLTALNDVGERTFRLDASPVDFKRFNAVRPTLEQSVRDQPAQVLSRISKGAGRIAGTLSADQQRRALVALTHEDKVSVATLRGGAQTSDAAILDLADSVCTIVAESALPLGTGKINFSDVADRFISGLEMSAQGVASTDADRSRVWARTAEAANDPVMKLRVSDVLEHYDQGTVTFQIANRDFAARVQYEVVRFAMEVAKHPGQPDIARLSTYPGLGN